MRIVLGHDFEGGSWPVGLGTDDAAICVSWVGLHVIVGLLETALGLTGSYPDDTDRAAGLASTVTATSGFWDAGFRSAPTGQARLDALAALTHSVLPGLPDRIDAIRAALETRNPGIESVRLADTEDAFPFSCRRGSRGFSCCRQAGYAAYFGLLRIHPADPIVHPCIACVGFMHRLDASTEA